MNMQMNAHAYKMIVLIFYDSETTLISSIYIISTTNSLHPSILVFVYWGQIVLCICVQGTNQTMRITWQHGTMLITNVVHLLAHETYGAGNQDKSTNHNMHGIMFMKHMLNMV